MLPRTRGPQSECRGKVVFYGFGVLYSSNQASRLGASPPAGAEVAVLARGQPETPPPQVVQAHFGSGPEGLPPGRPHRPSSLPVGPPLRPGVGNRPTDPAGRSDGGGFLSTNRAGGGLTFSTS